MTTPTPQCPAWCRSHLTDPDDGAVVHMSESTPIQVDDPQTRAVAAWIERVDYPGDPVVIRPPDVFLSAQGIDYPMPPEQAWELAKALASSAWAAVRDGARP